MSFQIVKTADGSDTIYLSELDETYHSIFGAIQEAQHVFIDNGIALLQKKSLNVLEIGFGTGLNALLTAKFATKNQLVIDYFTIEKSPLEKELLMQLSYASHSNPDELLFRKIHDAEWEKKVNINDYFNIKKIKVDVLQTEIDIEPTIDIIFFDAFAPSKQSEMWDEKTFKTLYHLLNVDGLLVTYSSAGIVKKALRASGFVVKRLKGPPGKHHILLAIKGTLKIENRNTNPLLEKQ
jgi:tRNA U34 5-methylaminomethyl-2-thiouridine-forming methyltransferase MnmC